MTATLTPGARRQLRAAERSLVRAERHLVRMAELLETAADEGDDSVRATAAEQTRDFVAHLAAVTAAVMEARANTTAPNPEVFNA